MVRPRYLFFYISQLSIGFHGLFQFSGLFSVCKIVFFEKKVAPGKLLFLACFATNFRCSWHPEIETNHLWVFLTYWTTSLTSSCQDIFNWTPASNLISCMYNLPVERIAQPYSHLVKCSCFSKKWPLLGKRGNSVINFFIGQFLALASQFSIVIERIVYWIYSYTKYLAFNWNRLWKLK
jgi:hypothetical protein